MMPGSDTFSPFFAADIRTSYFSADVLKKCALIALHSIEEEGRSGENGCHGPDLGDEWELGCPESPIRESESEAWSEDEAWSSSDSRADNVCNESLHVVGSLSLLEGLTACKGGIELSHGPGRAVPGNARGLVVGRCCQEACCHCMEWPSLTVEGL